MCCCSVTESCTTLCEPVDCSSMPGFPVLHYLPEFAQTHVHWVNDAVQPSPLLPPSPPAINLAQHQSLFQRVGSSHQVAQVLKYWSFSLSISPYNRYSELISFRIDPFDLLAVQGTLILTQHLYSSPLLLSGGASSEPYSQRSKGTGRNDLRIFYPKMVKCSEDRWKANKNEVVTRSYFSGEVRVCSSN